MAIIDRGLTETQIHAIKAMAKRQIDQWPETRFTITNHSTYAEHPACGGGTALYINQNTAMSLADMNLANISDDKVWLSKTAIHLIRAGQDLRR